MQSLTERAAAFAKAAHESINQKRKYSGEPYFVHPAAVAEIVRSTGARDEVIAAAYLHDVVEDTPVTPEEIEREFGPDVAALVEMVTDVSRPEDGNRKIRKAMDRDHLALASDEGKTIKLADLIHNTESIVASDPHFARVYLREKAELMPVLRGGDAALWDKAAGQIA